MTTADGPECKECGRGKTAIGSGLSVQFNMLPKVPGYKFGELCADCETEIKNPQDPSKGKRMRSKWNDNTIQFPRLISEIAATQELDMQALSESTGLCQADLDELFDRAHECWELEKAVHT